MIQPDEPNLEPWRGPAGWRGQALADFSAFAFLDLPWSLSDKDDPAPDGLVCVKSSASRRVLRIPRGPDQPALYAKRYRSTSLRRKLSATLIGGKARREFALTRELVRRGIPAPVPLAWAEATRPIFQSHPKPASFLLTLEWPNDGSLKQVIESGRLDPGTALNHAAAFIAQAHASGFYHDDLSTDHLLVKLKDNAPTFAFIDVDNGKLTKGPVGQSDRAMNLFQILRSINPERLNPETSRGFIEAYQSAASEITSAANLALHVSAISKRKINRDVLA